MGVEVEDFGDDGSSSPVRAKDLDDGLDGSNGGLSDRKDGVSKPSHAKIAQLVIKEFASELLGKEGNVLDDGETNAPLAVEGKLDDGGEE